MSQRFPFDIFGASQSIKWMATVFSENMNLFRNISRQQPKRMHSIKRENRRIYGFFFFIFLANVQMKIKSEPPSRSFFEMRKQFSSVRGKFCFRFSALKIKIYLLFRGDYVITDFSLNCSLSCFLCYTNLTD